MMAKLGNDSPPETRLESGNGLTHDPRGRAFKTGGPCGTAHATPPSVLRLGAFCLATSWAAGLGAGAGACVPARICGRSQSRSRSTTAPSLAAEGTPVRRTFDGQLVALQPEGGRKMDFPNGGRNPSRPHRGGGWDHLFRQSRRENVRADARRPVALGISDRRLGGRFARADGRGHPLLRFVGQNFLRAGAGRHQALGICHRRPHHGFRVHWRGRHDLFRFARSTRLYRAPG
jgi:hypothetical protein